jgi:transposase
MFYLGIDQHAKQLTVNLRDHNGDVVLRRQVSTRPAKVLEFFERLTARCAKDGCGFWAVVEVCGFNDWLLEMLKNFRCQKIILVQPENSDKRKTDRRDAAALSELLWLYRDKIINQQPIKKLRIVHQPTTAQNQLRRLTSLRKDARVQVGRAINRIKSVLRRHNLQHDSPTKTFPTIAALSWIQTIKLPAADRLEMDHASEDLERSQLRVAELDVAIAKLSESDQDAQLLMKTAGIAQFSAAALSSRIAGIARFKRPRALANYFGLTPGCRNSGEKKDRLGHITKAGSSLARWVLGQASKHILRTDPAMRAWFKKLKRKRGSKIARVAVMRRMATVIWHMLTKRKTWTEVRSLGIGLQQPNG